MNTLDPSKPFIQIPGRIQSLLVIPNDLAGLGRSYFDENLNRTVYGDYGVHYYLILANYMSILPFFAPLLMFTIALSLAVATHKIFGAVNALATNET